MAESRALYLPPWSRTAQRASAHPLCSVSGRPRPRAAQRRPLRAAGAGRPVAQNVPYGAAGSAEDVARAALFLADPNLAFVTGTELAVDVE